MSKCHRCIEQGRAEYFGSEPRCAFESGEFSSDNWACATCVAIRKAMGEGEGGGEDHLWLRRNDQSYGVLYVPPNPKDIPDGERVGPWRGGGLIAGYWYKHRGQTEMLIRVDPRDGGREEDSAKRLTLVEAEAALNNLRLNQPLTSTKAR